VALAGALFFRALARDARLEERPCLATAKSNSFVEARGERSHASASETSRLSARRALGLRGRVDES